jgi:hypothetical protein
VGNNVGDEGEILGIPCVHETDSLFELMFSLVRDLYGDCCFTYPTRSNDGGKLRCIQTPSNAIEVGRATYYLPATRKRGAGSLPLQENIIRLAAFNCNRRHEAVSTPSDRRDVARRVVCLSESTPKFPDVHPQIALAHKRIWPCVANESIS